MDAGINLMMQQQHHPSNAARGASQTGMLSGIDPGSLGFSQQQQQVQQQAQQQAQAQAQAQANQQAQQVKKKTTGPIHNPRYKSILCDHWERNNGTCPYAEKCQFAHGPAELAKWQAHRQRQQQTQQGPPQQPQQVQQHQIFTSPTKIMPQQQQMIGLSQQPQLYVSASPSGYQISSASPFHHQLGNSKTSGAVLSTTPIKADMYAAFAQQQQHQDLYSAAYPTSAASLASPPQMYPSQSSSMSISPAQTTTGVGSNGSGMFSALPPAQYNGNSYGLNGSYGNGQKLSQPISIGSQRSPSPALYGNQQDMYGSRSASGQQRQTPAGSLSSTPPGVSPFNMMGASSYAQQPPPGSSRRSVSPDNDVRSHQDLMDVAVPRSASDPRRTASLPQLFSRDFLASLSAEGHFQQTQQAQQQQPQQQQQQVQHRLPMANDLSIDTMLSNSMQPQSQIAPSPSPPLPHYPSYRRGSAPPVVLSVVTNSLGDYNSLADLDSLADEMVSEPATAGASQLFNMPTVFPGSIQGSINEYL